MKKRDIIEEILSVKSRTEFNSREDYSSSLSEIENMINELCKDNGEFNQELYKYIPISTVACFEAFFKSIVKELIDFGKPFSENISKYNQSKNIKLDFEVVGAIQSKSLTVGEFIAHVLSYNNFVDINSNISILIDKDFLSELKSFNKISKFETTNSIHEIFHNKTGEIIESIKQTFELRHIFCHEFATNLQISRSTILSNFENCKIFLDYTNIYIYELLYPNSPETQIEMNLHSQKIFEKYDSQLTELVESIKNVSNQEYIFESFDLTLFDETITRWKEYRKLHAEYKASCVKGGSIYPLIYSSDLIYITKEKIKSLENEFEILLRKIKNNNIDSDKNGFEE